MPTAEGRLGYTGSVPEACSLVRQCALIGGQLKITRQPHDRLARAGRDTVADSAVSPIV